MWLYNPGTQGVIEAPSERLRSEHYLESLLMLEEVSPEHPMVRQLRFELEALRELPPGSGGLSPLLGGARL